MKKILGLLLLSLTMLSFQGCHDGISKEISPSLSPVEVVRKSIEAKIANDYDAWLSTLEDERRIGFEGYNGGRSREFGVITFIINSIEEVSDERYMEGRLSSDAAQRLGMTKENTTLVDVFYYAEYDGTKVPESGGNIKCRYTLFRRNQDSPWLIREWGYEQ